MKNDFISSYYKSESPEKIISTILPSLGHQCNVYLSIFIHQIKVIALFIELNTIIIHNEIFHSQNNIFFYNKIIPLLF